ncbi:MAG: ThiF family adenylyltransferase [Candidatus Melainabacteria bacterium]|nr:ThiF family adenylyltransferase [Candidatus Melainabacteria bacterium]
MSENLQPISVGDFFSPQLRSPAKQQSCELKRFTHAHFVEVIPFERRACSIRTSNYHQGPSIISLTKDQLERYRHQLSMPGMTKEKQERLISSSCLLVAGDAPLETTIKHLIAAGVGKIIVIGEAFSLSAMSAIASHAGNLDVTVEFHQLPASGVTSGDDHQVSESIIENVDLVVEASLDWQFKLRLCDFCMRLGVPMIHSGSSGLRFQIFTMVPGKSACLRCALPRAGIDDFPITPVERSTFAPIATCAGALMASESIKLLANLGASQGNELWKVDGLSGEIEIIRGLDPRQDCPDCGRASRPR